jgi:hypothetical protein
MLIVIPFCHKDALAAVKLLEWIFKLDGQSTRHRCLAVGSKGISDDLAFTVEDAARKAYAISKMVRTTVHDERGWPQSCNTLFTCTATYIHDTLKCPFWWNEPDCVPLKTGWLDALEEEYIKSKKPFMGSVVTKPCTHLTGCAIYPFDIGFYNNKLLGTQNPIAWDCISPELTLQHTHHTNLFQHCWDDPKTGKVATFPTVESLAMVRSDAVVFHRNKDLTLIDRLRESRSLPPVETVTEQCSGPNVFTYFDDINRPNEVELMKYWKSSWRKHGWTPVILGDADFSSVKGSERFKASVSKLPTINTKEYELACYKRWLAMSVRGGLMVDYDVLNYGFTPDMAVKQNGTLVFYEAKIPSAVLGSARQFQRMCNELERYEPCKEDNIDGKPHVSDMFVVQRLWENNGFKHVPVMKQFGEDGWKDALLVHYPNARTKGNKIGAILQHP